MRICSFDIGIKNFSVCIEDYPIDPESFKLVSNDGMESKSLNEQVGKPPKIKYKKGTLEATDEMKSFVCSIAKLGTIVHLERKELGDRKHYFSGAAYHNLYNWVDELHQYLQSTDIILIEQQMRINNVALSLMSHLQACLLLKYCRHSYFEFSSKEKKQEIKKESKPDTDEKPKRGRKKKQDTSSTPTCNENINVTEVINQNPYTSYPCTVKLYPSKNKTRILGAALKEENEDGQLKKVSKYNRKKWSVMEVDKILKERNDDRWHNYIFKENKSKKDDLSDVIVQSLSYIISKYI
jgi:hypothetical protein